eukprot:8964011-Alexandrium_andersonii.AAC.1
MATAAMIVTLVVDARTETSAHRRTQGLKSRTALLLALQSCSWAAQQVPLGRPTRHRISTRELRGQGGRPGAEMPSTKYRAIDDGQHWPHR